MNAPRISSQGVGMGRGGISSIRRWVCKRWARLIVIGLGLALIAGQIGCQSSVSIKPAESEASKTTTKTRLIVVPQPRTETLRVFIKESK